MQVKRTTNTTSLEFAGNKTFPANRDRQYLYITMLDTVGTLTIGNGTGKLPLGVGGYFEPTVCPTGKLVVETTGKFLIIMG